MRFHEKKNYNAHILSDIFRPIFFQAWHNDIDYNALHFDISFDYLNLHSK